MFVSPSSPAAAEAGPPPKSGAGVGGRRMSVSVARLSAGLRFSSSRGSGCEPWVGDPALAFYPGTRAIARPPETMQSQSRHDAATPPLWRSLERPCAIPCCSARERIEPSLRDFQDRARGDDPRRDVPPQRDHEL